MGELIVSVSGVRGIFDKTLTSQVAWEFGCAFGAMLGRRKRTVVVGRDTRASGAALRKALTDGLKACGADVIDLGVVTTPGTALMTKALGAAGGVVITASHNPLPYNGLKFLQSSGIAFTATMADKLKTIWDEKQFTLAPGGGSGGESQNTDTHATHVEAVCGICDPAAIAAKKFTVALDSINGAGCIVTPMLLERLGCRLIHINAEPTGIFAHTPEPLPANLDQLSQAVTESGADVGFAQDPDGDRLVLADETGKVISEEYTLALAAQQVLRDNKGNVAVNLSTSRMIDDVAAAAGVEVVRTPTGEANVVEAMQRTGCIFGGEGGGGVIDPRVGGVRNSLVAIALILQALTDTDQTISQLAAGVGSCCMIKTKLPYQRRAVRQLIKRTREAFESRQGAKFNDADGLRIDLPHSWVSLRGSNTEPIIRIIAEASDHAAAEALTNEVAAIAEKHG